MQHKNDPDTSRAGPGQLVSLAAWIRAIQRDSLDLFTRWNLAANDEVAGPIISQLERTWRQWPEDRRWLFLRTVEQVIYTEFANAAWNPKDDRTRTRYRTMAKDAIGAARWVTRLASRFPPPWDDPAHEPIRTLVGLLADFAWSGLFETSIADPDIARRIATGMLIQLEEHAFADSPTRKRVSRRLFGQLVWLGMGRNRQVAPHESTIRRYLREPKVKPTPAARQWKRSVKLMVQVERLVPVRPGQSRPQTFRKAIDAFLRPKNSH